MIKEWLSVLGVKRDTEELNDDVDTKVKVTNYANKQINVRLSKLLEQMEIAEQKLLDYKKKNNLIDIGDIKDLSLIHI